MLTATSILTVGIEYPLEEVWEEEIEPVLHKICSDSQPLEKTFEIHLSELFSLRMKTIYQLLQEGVDFKKVFEAIKERLPELEKKIEKRGRLLLAENFAFALTLSIEITNPLLETYQSEISSKDDIDRLLKMKFEDFISLIHMEALPQMTRQCLIEMTRMATFLDFAMLLTFFYAEKGLEVAENKLSELLICLRNWAQLYGALAQELKIWRTGAPREEVEFELRTEEVEDEKELADMGLKDYLESILKHEETI